MSVIKRFIAGAVCPRCSSMDSLKMYRDDEYEYRECIRCDFTDQMRRDGQPMQAELPTRVNKPVETPKQDAEVKPLKFFPNPSLRRDH